MTIININGGNQAACKCRDWLQHWRNFSTLPMPSQCPGLSCRELAEVAVFVQRGDAQDNGWYIVPLCKQHSQSQLALEISSFTPLVSANVSETCDRS